jgi:hypothetical protein
VSVGIAEARDDLTAGAFGLENTMAVRVTPKSTQHTSLHPGPQGTIPPGCRDMLNLAETAEQGLEQRLLGVCGGIVTGRNIQEIWLAILDEASPPAQSKEGLSLAPL